MSTGSIRVAFLRAVNVGGRRVEMARLRGVLAGLGLGDVRTYIASGNAFFTSSESDHTALVEHIETGLAEAFGFEIPTILRTVPELRSELAASPFMGRRPTADERFSMLFTSAALPTGVTPPCSPKGDWEVLNTFGGTAYVRWRVHRGRSTNPASTIEKAYGVRATARFFHTTEKILAAAERD